MTDSIAALERQEQELVFDSFDHADAWRLGSRLTAVAQKAGHPVGIDIRRPGLVLFRAALPGSTPDQETWIVRKAAVVLRNSELELREIQSRRATRLQQAASGTATRLDVRKT